MQARRIFPNNTRADNHHYSKEKWVDNLEQAEKHLKTADHMAYVTLTILKENRMIIKILEELYLCSVSIIKALLQYEYAFKRIRLYKDPKMNLKTFKEKISQKYFDEKEIKTLFLIINIQKKHKESHVEFVKKDKFVILLGDKYEVITIEIIRNFLSSLKKAIISIKSDLMKN